MEKNDCFGFFFMFVYSVGFAVWIVVENPCPPVRNNIVTPRHLLIDFWTEPVGLSLHYNITKPNRKTASPIHRFFTFFSNLGMLIWPDHHKNLDDSNA